MTLFITKLLLILLIYNNNHLFGGQVENIKKLNTSLGTLSIDKISETEKVLSLDGQPLIRDYIIYITNILPSEQNPKVIFIFNSTGGNACCLADNILDLTSATPMILKDIQSPNFKSKEVPIYQTNDGIIYQAFSKNSGPFGEPVFEVCQYLYGSGKVKVLRSSPQYSTSGLKEKETAHDIFNDPNARKPLIRLLGPKVFNELRFHMQVCPKLLWFSDSLVWGTGCTAHACTISEGAFLIDIKLNTSWAIIMDPSGNKFYGPKLNQTSPEHRIFSEWVNDHHLFWNQFSFITSPNIQNVINKSIITNSTNLISENGVLKVQAIINDTIPLSFIVDSGASDVVIPADVVLTLIRTGTLLRSDFIGSRTYRLADGSLVPSTTFKLKSMKVGNRVLSNVIASMTSVDGALLLGQSFLNRLGKWSINNNKQILEFE